MTINLRQSGDSITLELDDYFINDLSGIEQVKAKRSHLFIPGNKIEKIDYALASKPDVLIIDLEDSIPPAEKEKTRDFLRNFLPKSENTEVAIRLNPLSGDEAIHDIELLQDLKGRFDSISVAKAEKVQNIELLKDYFPSIGLYVFFETPLGIENCATIMERLSKNDFVGVGAGDICMSFGIPRIPIYESDILKILFSRVAIHAHHFKLGFIDTISRPYKTDQAKMILSKEALWTKSNIGSIGKRAIHPSQVEVINKVFTPSVNEIRAQIELLNSFLAEETTRAVGKPGFVYSGTPEYLTALRKIRSWIRFGFLSLESKQQAIT